MRRNPCTQKECLCDSPDTLNTLFFAQFSMLFLDFGSAFDDLVDLFLMLGATEASSWIIETIHSQLSHIHNNTTNTTSNSTFSFPKPWIQTFGDQLVRTTAIATSAAATSSHSMTFTQLCADLAPWASIVVFLAPTPTIQRIRHDKAVGNLPLLPYTSMIGSAFLWTVYGFLKDEYRIWSSNGLGLVLGLYYFYSFVQHCPRSSATLPGSVMQHLQFILAMIVGTVTLATLLSDDSAARIIGFGGVCLAVALFASPLSVLKLVLEKKSAVAIPLPFTVASLINCFLWSVFGIFVMEDWNIIVPNVLGLLCSTVQLALKIVYSGGPPSSASELPR